jgi:mannose-6-phosphate isomerase-like protein (cupin superfamily)
MEIIASKMSSCMNHFVTKKLAHTYDVLAPDGSEVRILATGQKGSMAQFSLPPGVVSKAVAHRTVEELWYFTGGRGRMWRKLGAEETTIDVRTGVSISIPVGAHFQFRCDGDQPLQAVGVTMPPWPGMEEAYAVEGVWPVDDQRKT